jgi:hypothetical protein
MKFDEAFDKAFEIEQKCCEREGLGHFFIQLSTAKILAFMWNIIVAAEKKEDFAYVDSKKNVVIVPAEKKKLTKNTTGAANTVFGTTPNTKNKTKKKTKKSTGEDVLDGSKKL